MEEKEHGKLRSLLYFGLIPLLVMFVLGLFLLNWLGFPVWKTAQEWGSELPVLGYIIPAPDSTVTNEESESETWKEQYHDSQAKLKEATQKLTALNKEIESNQQELQEAKKSNEELQLQLEQKEEQKNNAQMKKVAAIYENMSPSKAASMLESMSLEDASLTISMLDQDQQSSILGSMKDVKRAAQITMLQKEIGTFNTSDPALLKQQLHELVQNEQDQAETVAETIAGIPPAQAAVLVQSMMKTNEQTAMGLMKQINTTSRSQILTEIAKKDAALAAEITVHLEK